MKKCFLSFFVITVLGLALAIPAYAVSTVTVTATWQYPVPDATHGAATGARIERSMDGGTFATACTATAPTATCSDTPQVTGHEYTYRVILTNGFGEGPASPPFVLGAYGPGSASGVNWTYSVQP